jgi:DNA uptake protein ComE-like DNA-binding protein
MSVRVVARVRPLLKSEREEDIIIRSGDATDGSRSSLLKIPNPKNLCEEYSFQFNSVYGSDSTQQEIFDAEVTPTVKHLFLGYDVTLFAYGSTGTGKTHTMRGGKTLIERGMIPRLLSSIYRKSRALEKSSNGQAAVEVSMSYYEVYNDRVFDLFEPPEKRTATGLPIREAEGGKTVVVGLTEVPCGTLKEFESLYDKANANRSTGATKLNAHSSRSHAILCVKVSIATPTETRVSTVSAIDLAGSEDNRRTGNGPDRMVESASINKSLFVLAQCVEAISKKQPRIPYRESKMTRILSLGQNNGFTVMILNLAPVKSYHLDTLSSLNFANRTKKIEVREVENEPVFKGPPRQPAGVASVSGSNIQRQPLRPLANGVNLNITNHRDATNKGKPEKLFSVYSDKHKTTTQKGAYVPTRSSPNKRSADTSLHSSRPTKTSRPTPSFLRRGPEHLTKATVESLVEAKVSEILAARAMNAPPAIEKDIPEEVQKRLDSIEQRLAGQEGERAEGLSYLFMAKQHQARGEDASALRMYRLALPYFPGNVKLEGKIERLEMRLGESSGGNAQAVGVHSSNVSRGVKRNHHHHHHHILEQEDDEDEDEEYHDDDDDAEYTENHYDEASDESFHALQHAHHPKQSKKQQPKTKLRHPNARTAAVASRSPDPLVNSSSSPSTSTLHLQTHLQQQKILSIINSRDISKIQSLPGLGIKRAEGIVSQLVEWDSREGNGERVVVESWEELGSIRGVGRRVLEGLRGV